jgi:hypothetical protein
MLRIAAVRLVALLSMSLLSLCFIGCSGKEKESASTVVSLPVTRVSQPVSDSPGTNNLASSGSARSAHRRGAAYRREQRQQHTGQ